LGIRKEAAVTKNPNLVSLKAASRHEVIRHILGVNGKVSTSELAARLKVSSVTIREYLKFLERNGVLTRTRGGAVAVHGNGVELSLELTSMTKRAEKRAIGSAAARMVEPNQTVIIDVGSTTTALAKLLPPNLTRVTVITNGLNIALSLENMPGISVIVTGGTLRPLQHSLVAPMGTILLDKLKADIAFLGCNGVDPARGFTNTNIAEAEIKQAMVRSANQVVFLADSDKIGKVASAFVADIADADLLITDSGVDQIQLRELQARGLKVELVEPGESKAARE
jgi:DeoR family transcriptional regulator of aga operon